MENDIYDKNEKILLFTTILILLISIASAAEVVQEDNPSTTDATAVSNTNTISQINKETINNKSNYNTVQTTDTKKQNNITYIPVTEQIRKTKVITDYKEITVPEKREKQITEYTTQIKEVTKTRNITKYKNVTVA